MRDALFDQQTIAALQQKLAASEPVAWCLQSNGDGSYGEPVVFTGYAMYEQNLAKARQDPWIVNGAAKLVPLYAAPPRTYEDGLESELSAANRRISSLERDLKYATMGEGGRDGE
jgi:hypothetical protein